MVLTQDPSTNLAPLQDECPLMPLEEVTRVVEADLLGGEALSTVFERFDDVPLGSASISTHSAATEATVICDASSSTVDPAALIKPQLELSSAVAISSTTGALTFAAAALT